MFPTARGRSPQGSRFLGAERTLPALAIRRLPYTIRSSVAILQQIPMSIEEAAISLGASKMKAFFRITAPMMASGIVSGAILSWVTMIGELSGAIILYTGKSLPCPWPEAGAWVPAGAFPPGQRKMRQASSFGEAHLIFLVTVFQQPH